MQPSAGSASLLKLKNVSLWITGVRDQTWFLRRPKIRDFTNLRTTSLKDLRKYVAYILHLECQVAEAWFVDPWLITMMGNGMLVYFQKRAFKFGEFEPDRVDLGVREAIASRNDFP